MSVNPLGINFGTQGYVRFEDDGGTINTQVIDVRQGTVEIVSDDIGNIKDSVEWIDFNLKAGTLNFGSVTNIGSISTIGTMPAISIGESTGGTLDLITRVGNIGTLEVGTVSVGSITGIGTITNIGTITTLPNIPQGSIQVTAGTEVITGGSIVVTSGTIATGSIIVTAGTIAAHAITSATVTTGTLQNLVSGTINSATCVLGTLPGLGTVTNLGSVTNIGSIGNIGTLGVGTVSVGSIPGVGTLTNVGSVTSIGLLYGGTVVTSSGTITNSGTTTGVGVVSMLTAGTVSMINAGTLTSLGTVPGIGTITNIGSISSIGTMPAISVGNATGGTLDLIKDGTVHIDSGTITSLGTAIGIGTVTNVGSITNIGALYGGSIVITSGTVTSLASGTTVGTINAGTIDLLKAGTISMINAGTITSVGSVVGMGVVTNLTSGSVRMTLGTLTSGSLTNVGSVVNIAKVHTGGTVPNILGGTITQLLNAGTIQNILGGTVKLDGRTGRNVLSYCTTFTGTASYGTLVGSAAVGAGTSVWVNDVSINNPSTNAICVVGFGTALTGSSVLLRGTFGTTAGVGQQKSYPLPVNCGMTNQDLVVYVSAAATIDVNVSYFISA